MWRKSEDPSLDHLANNRSTRGHSHASLSRALQSSHNTSTSSVSQHRVTMHKLYSNDRMRVSCSCRLHVVVQSERQARLVHSAIAANLPEAGLLCGEAFSVLRTWTMHGQVSVRIEVRAVALRYCSDICPAQNPIASAARIDRTAIEAKLRRRDKQT